MQVKIDKLPKSQVKINIIVPQPKVKEAYNAVLDAAVEGAEIPGFRKGKAPKDKVLEKTDLSKLYGEVVNVLLENFYPRALKEHLVVPISNPKVEIKEFDLEKDFEFEATLATKPDVTLGDYRKDLKEFHAKKTEELKKQNEEKLKAGEEMGLDHAHMSQNEMIEIMVGSSKVDVADILIEQETDRMLTRIMDQVTQIGLTIEKYLETQSKTLEELRADYEKIAERSLAAEFVMGTMVKEEGVQITDEELLEALKASGVENPEARLQDANEKWYIKSILEKNKLITKLAEEIEGKHDHE